MLSMYRRIIILICLKLASPTLAIQTNVFLSNLRADRQAPLPTTYTAHLSRSEFPLDQGFHLGDYQPERGIEFSTDKAGNWSLLFKIGDRIYWDTASMYQVPVITHSYPDLIKFYFQPNDGVRVDALFHVYSSRIAILYLDFRNLSDQDIELEWYSYLHNPYRMFNDFKYHPRDPAEREQIQRELFDCLQTDPNPFIAENESLFANIPKLKSADEEIQLLYYSAFNLIRQVMLPAEGRCGFNYYVFSSEPTWGWGHGGQVFHERITMLAYAFLDARSAMYSQRIYRRRQYDNGYINYCTGPYLDEIIEHEGELTSSVPWYAWLNWEVFTITKDYQFLLEIYESSKRFYHYYTSNRDKDGDGLCEWGGHAVLESVRDAYVAVWDEVGWPSQFEALDLNGMLVMEAEALAQMAERLTLQEEAEQWRRDAQKRRKQINETFWDEQSGFYYHVSRDKHTFSHRSGNDLKRVEIIGFLPLWAGIATPKQARRLVDHQTDDLKFWCSLGIPSLSADDPYYNDKRILKQPGLSTVELPDHARINQLWI